LLFWGISYLSLTSVFVYAQNITKQSKHKNTFTIGFHSGRDLLFNSSPLLHNKQSKIHYPINSGFVLRKPINTHFKAEVRINYSSIQSQPAIDKIFGGSSFATAKTNKTSIPATIQYYPLNKHKLQPFLGAGLQYNFSPINNNSSTVKSDKNYTASSFPESGTKYIRIIFTQGITYEVNTKIQITQSFHFIPNTNKIIGIDLGLGYTLP